MFDGRHLDFTWSIKNRYDSKLRLAAASQLPENHYRFYYSSEQRLALAVFNCVGKDGNNHIVTRLSNAYTLPAKTMKTYGNFLYLTIICSFSVTNPSVLRERSTAKNRRPLD